MGIVRGLAFWGEVKIGNHKGSGNEKIPFDQKSTPRIGYVAGLYALKEIYNN